MRIFNICLFVFATIAVPAKMMAADAKVSGESSFKGASAELGEKKIEEAKIEYEKIVEDAKSKASDVINMAQQQSQSN